MASPGLDWRQADKARRLPPEPEADITWRRTAGETETDRKHGRFAGFTAGRTLILLLLRCMLWGGGCWRWGAASGCYNEQFKRMGKDGATEALMRGWVVCVWGGCNEG